MMPRQPENQQRSQALLPIWQWLPQYQRSWLGMDLIAGITLAAYAIPVSLAYAALAGLPPQMGLYCYLVGGVAYALFGTSRKLAIGPTSAIAMLVGTTVSGMANGDATRWAEIAALTALVVAGIGGLAWLLRLSGLVNFISETILIGFKAGAAITIALTQLPKLFGVPGGGDHLMEAAGGEAAAQGLVQFAQAERMGGPGLSAGPLQDPELLPQLADIGGLFSLVRRFQHDLSSRPAVSPPTSIRL